MPTRGPRRIGPYVLILILRGILLIAMVLPMHMGALAPVALFITGCSIDGRGSTRRLAATPGAVVAIITPVGTSVTHRYSIDPVLMGLFVIDVLVPS